MAARALGDSALLAAIPGQEDNDTVGFAELVRAKNQGVGCIQRHEGIYCTGNASLQPHQVRREYRCQAQVGKEAEDIGSVVMKIDDASAGSTFAARSPSGTSVPAVAATNMLMIIAAP